MLLKPLILGVSIDFGLLSIALTLRFIIYPLYQSWISQKNLVNEKTIVEDLEKRLRYELKKLMDRSL
ncbi:MAG: hypothetical protein ACLRQF_22455 [Thomasclavelia ramosa]